MMQMIHAERDRASCREPAHPCSPLSFTFVIHIHTALSPLTGPSGKVVHLCVNILHLPAASVRGKAPCIHRRRHTGSVIALASGCSLSLRESVVYWYSFSNPLTKCIHCDNCLALCLMIIRLQLIILDNAVYFQLWFGAQSSESLSLRSRSLLPYE